MNKPIILHNSEEYEDPNQYDVENDRYVDDIPFLSKWALQASGCIIDLGCGTGRVTIPLATEGYHMIGVDIHRGMLDQAVKKSMDRNVAVEWIQQDCSELQLNVTSSFIFMVGNSFQHFLTNEAQNKLLQSVNRHLEHQGIFIFNTRFPSMEELFQPSSEEFWKSYVNGSDGETVDISTICSYNSLNNFNTTLP
ncbi:hypothetical protein JCM16418A_13560 [Paenibacillus pini]|uniref:Methyltransferase n=1 Tax=Paenibacillus pini JCM 16418 TaxID=1236976 RepID=W7YJ58_9BACL|nr:methyltransferase [Paenibacillus pini JCM 16418]